MIEKIYINFHSQMEALDYASCRAINREKSLSLPFCFNFIMSLRIKTDTLHVRNYEILTIFLFRI